MSRFSGFAPVVHFLGLIGLLSLGAGCGSNATLAGLGVSGLHPSKSWTAADPSSFVVPGRAIAAWRSPEGGSLVVLRALAAPRTNAAGLASELTTRLENLPELRIVKSSLRLVGGVRSAIVEIVAPGPGDALAPSGLGRPIAVDDRPLIPTRRIAVGIPGRNQTVWLIWHAPESAAASLSNEVESVLERLVINDPPSSSS